MGFMAWSPANIAILTIASIGTFLCVLALFVIKCRKREKLAPEPLPLHSTRPHHLERRDPVTASKEPTIPQRTAAWSSSAAAIPPRAEPVEPATALAAAPRNDSIALSETIETARPTKLVGVTVADPAPLPGMPFDDAPPPPFTRADVQGSTLSAQSYDPVPYSLSALAALADGQHVQPETRQAQENLNREAWRHFLTLTPSLAEGANETDDV